MSASEIASGQWVNLSMIVRRNEYPFDGGRGPTRSICIPSKWLSGGRNNPKGVTVCSWILDRWQERQDCNHCWISFCMWGHTKREEMSCCVALMPGWERECNLLKVCLWKDLGTNGLGTLVDTSQIMVLSDDGNGRGLSWSDKDDGLERNDNRSESTCCLSANSLKSTALMSLLSIVMLLMVMRDSASTTGFETPWYV